MNICNHFGYMIASVNEKYSKMSKLYDDIEVLIEGSSFIEDVNIINV